MNLKIINFIEIQFPEQFLLILAEFYSTTRDNIFTLTLMLFSLANCFTWTDP